MQSESFARFGNMIYTVFLQSKRARATDSVFATLRRVALYVPVTVSATKRRIGNKVCSDQKP